MYTVHAFALDGDSIKEDGFSTKEFAQEYIDDIGSKWCFYPIYFVGTDKFIFTNKGRKRIDTVKKMIVGIYENNHIDDESIVWIYDFINS